MGLAGGQWLPVSCFPYASFSCSRVMLHLRGGMLIG